MCDKTLRDVAKSSVTIILRHLFFKIFVYPSDRLLHACYCHMKSLVAAARRAFVCQLCSSPSTIESRDEHITPACVGVTLEERVSV